MTPANSPGMSGMATSPDVSDILRQVRRIELRTQRLVTSLAAGGYRSAFKGQGMEFDEVREYAAGDDVRSIDWNVTARAGRPYVKVFREERELTIVLVVDVSASMRFGASAMRLFDGGNVESVKRRASAPNAGKPLPMLAADG